MGFRQSESPKVKMNQDQPRAGPGVYAGLLLTTLSTLAYQLLLTRIFSVTMWYHYTFMAISVTMFGMTVGAILVYLLPRAFAAAAAARRMALAASCFAVLIVVSFAIHVRIPFFNPEAPLSQLWLLILNYALLSLPFIASGACVTIALTRFPGQVGKLYAADLVGAGLGCLVVAVASRWIFAPTLVLDVAAIAALGAVCCLLETTARWWLLPSAAALFVLAFAVSLSTPDGHQAEFLRLRWIKGHDETEDPPIYETWNSFSRVAVWEAGSEPIGWGFSSHFKPEERTINQRRLNIDASAVTVMTEFRGDLGPLDYLRYDVTNVAHYLRPDSRVLVIGSGGGRDVLSALYFGQPEIVGVEINDAILETVNGRFGDFTGHLDRVPGVSFVNDEARSYIARTDKQFDIIQVSLIDTWAATAAGAYVLTENALYTTEAWTRMMQRLTDRGVISFSRWYSVDGPQEVYRLTAVAVATLTQLGVTNPRDHLVIVYSPPDPKKRQPTGLATLLASRRPFSSEDIDRIEGVAEKLAFELLLSPRPASDETLKKASDETLEKLASGEDFDAFIRDFPIDIAPPTDDRPFFFDMIRLGDVLTYFFEVILLGDESTFERLISQGLEPNLAAIETLGWLLLTVIVLTGVCVILPLGLTTIFTGRQALRGSLPLFVYFCSIGLGFMLVEIAMIQRLSVFLGHPIYSMTVVLFCLLVATGGGSWLSGRLVQDAVRGPRAPACLAVLAGTVLLLGLLAPPLLFRLDAIPTPGRIAIACGLLLPLGLVMGMGFPLGIRAASHHAAALTPWLFGMNGAMSICGSVVGVVIALSFGITAALLAGVACYLSALLSFLWARQQRRGLAGT